MRTRSTVLGGLIAGFLVVSMAAGVGAQESPSPGASPTGSSLANSEWLLSSVGSAPVASGINANILFTDTDASGFAGCNNFFGSYTTSDGSGLTIGPVATTMKLCDDATNTFEQSYLAALAEVASYAIGTDGTLTLSDSSGAAVLTFAPTAPASLEGPWIVTSFNNGNNGVETVPDGIGATITFHGDGTVEGSGGCNNFFGGYGVNDTNVTIGPLMSTLMACDDATNTFEVQYMAALEAATTWSVTSTGLELRDDSGALQVAATSAIGH